MLNQGAKQDNGKKSIKKTQLSLIFEQTQGRYLKKHPSFK